jgi:hypothetical protein
MIASGVRLTIVNVNCGRCEYHLYTDQYTSSEWLLYELSIRVGWKVNELKVPSRITGKPVRLGQSLGLYANPNNTSFFLHRGSNGG